MILIANDTPKMSPADVSDFRTNSSGKILRIAKIEIRLNTTIEPSATILST